MNEAERVAVGYDLGVIYMRITAELWAAVGSPSLVGKPRQSVATILKEQERETE